MMRRRTPHGPLRRLRQSGNVLFTVFALLAGAGVIGATTTAILRGPVANTAKLSKQQIAATAMDAAARLVGSPHSATSDCDSDGSLEPVAWQAPAGSAPTPSGGGLLPGSLGAAKTDPWGSAYGYCVWDHGTQSVSDNVAGCGGSGANRLQGADTKTEPVIAIISAGPDRVFQTSCAAWLDANADGAPDHPLVVRVSGSDDIIHTESLDTLLKAGGSAQLPELPDDACTPETIGLMRFEMDTVQICTEDGWEEPGTAVTADGTFAPTNGAELSTTHTTSNTITFSGYFGTRTASVDNGGAIIVNGVNQGASAQIAAGDTVALRGAASATPATPVVYTLTISAVQRPWVLTTRNPTPVNLTIQPTTQNTMNVTGPGNPAFGATVSFLVRNTGETPTTLIASVLSNTTNFEFSSGGANVGDDCAGKTLGLNQTCVIDVRPRASDDGTYNGTLSARDGVRTAQSDLSGTATGWTCVANQDVSWEPGCSASSGAALANGANRTITNTNSSYDGTRTVTCTNGTLVQSGGGCVATLVCDGGGYPYAGYCYYYGAAAESCDAVCSARGGCNLAGTSYIGAGGTDARCMDVLAGLGTGGVFSGGGDTGFIGCHVHSYTVNVIRRRSTSSVTTCAASSTSGGSRRRACACNELDTTPDPFAFSDQIGVAPTTLITSAPITISGINTGTTVSVSGQGSPLISINGGAWVTTGTISNGQTLRVQLTSSASFSTALGATVNVGGVTDSWSVTTRAANVCSNTTINWAPGCSAPSGAMTHGQTKSVNNTASGYDGTRVITCNDGTLSQSGGSCTAAGGHYVALPGFAEGYPRCDPFDDNNRVGQPCPVLGARCEGRVVLGSWPRRYIYECQ